MTHVLAPTPPSSTEPPFFLALSLFRSIPLYSPSHQQYRAIKTARVQTKQADKYNIVYGHEAAAVWFVYMVRLVCADGGRARGQVTTKDK